MELEDSKFVPRVTQLDAVELDKEVIRVLKSQVVTASKYLKVGILGQWEPEIDASLRFIIWKFSVNRVYSTFGQQLLSLKYNGAYSKDKAALLAVVTIGSKYLKDRVMEISHLTGNQPLAPKLGQILKWVETVVEIATLLNLLVFFREGKYPTLPDRLLGLGSASVASVEQRRHIGYNFMMRELLWHGFIELLVFVLPLVNYHYIRRKCIGMFAWGKKAISSAQSLPFTVSTKCTICKKIPILPHTRGCGHVYCFYCIQAHQLADSKFECPLCGFSNEDLQLIIPLQVMITQHV